MRDGSAIEHLRSVTNARHEALHLHPMLTVIADPRQDADAYRRLLAGMLVYYSEADALLAAGARSFPEMSADLPPVSRAGLLAADLGAAPPAAEDAASLSVSLPAYIGTLYVVEGSVMGGASLQAAARCAAEGRAGTRYFDWCRSQGPARWRAARAVIEEVLLDPHQLHEAGAHAARSFDAFESALDEAARMTR